MLALKAILFIAGFILLFYMVFPFITVIISLFIKERKFRTSNNEVDFACIITAYKNIQIALPLVDSLLKQSYSNHLIYLVADGCDTSNINFSNSKVILLKPALQLSSKVKSIIHAIENFRRNHDAVVIFDPDNLAKNDFLSVLNNYMNTGFKAVQGQRTAKNLDTIYACADATGEIYKNYAERFVPYLLGSSPTIAGSGMAVSTDLFKEYLNCPDISENLKANRVIAAEDKILQNFLVDKGYQIAFAKDALLYDEKISTGSQAQRQRSRWLYSYFENFEKSIIFIPKGLFGFNVNQFIFGLTTSSPPLFILLLSALATSVCAAFASKPLFTGLVSGMLIFTGNIFLVLMLSNAPSQIWKSLWSLPLFIFRQFLALLNMQQSRKDFMHTQHGKMLTLDQVEGKI